MDHESFQMDIRKQNNITVKARMPGGNESVRGKGAFLGKADELAKKFVGQPEVFADLVNFRLYGGEQVVKPEDLAEMDTDEVITAFGKDRREGSRTVERFRDLLKSAAVKTDGVSTYMVIGVENQTATHYAMPVRAMLYDALQYAGQVGAMAKKHRAEMKEGTAARASGGEFLSGFYKSDRLTPVITIVMSFDTEGWRGPGSIREMLPELGGRLADFVSDYRINLIDPKALSDEEIDMFRTEMCEVARAVNCSSDKERYSRAVIGDGRFKCLHRGTAELINAVANLKIEIEDEGKEEVNMCKAMQELIEDGRNEGRIEGRIGDIRLLLKRLSEEQVAEYLEISIDEVRTAAGMAADAGTA